MDEQLTENKSLLPKFHQPPKNSIFRLMSVLDPERCQKKLNQFQTNLKLLDDLFPNQPQQPPGSLSRNLSRKNFQRQSVNDQLQASEKFDQSEQQLSKSTTIALSQLSRHNDSVGSIKYDNRLKKFVNVKEESKTKTEQIIPKIIRVNIKEHLKVQTGVESKQKTIVSRLDSPRIQTKSNNNSRNLRSVTQSQRDYKKVQKHIAKQEHYFPSLQKRSSNVNSSFQIQKKSYADLMGFNLDSQLKQLEQSMLEMSRLKSSTKINKVKKVVHFQSHDSHKSTSRK